jgi:hypothetical protein
MPPVGASSSPALRGGLTYYKNDKLYVINNTLNNILNV